MSRVARELGYTTMSLYRYVGSKDELYMLMLDAAIGEPPSPDAAAGWRPELQRWAWAARAVLRRHPWFVRIPTSGPPLGPRQLGWLEWGLRALGDTGLAEVEKLGVLQLVNGYGVELLVSRRFSGSVP